MTEPHPREAGLEAEIAEYERMAQVRRKSERLLAAAVAKAVAERDALQAEVDRLREIVNKQKARPEYRDLQRQIHNERRSSLRYHRERDVLQERLDQTLAAIDRGKVGSE